MWESWAQVLRPASRSVSGVSKPTGGCSNAVITYAVDAGKPTPDHRPWRRFVNKPLKPKAFSLVVSRPTWKNRQPHLP